MPAGRLARQGVKFGVCNDGPRKGCYVMVSDLRDRRGHVAAWLLEYNGGSCWADPYETTADSADELEQALALDGVEWLPDDEATLDLADRLFPRRLRSPWDGIVRGITRLLRH